MSHNKHKGSSRWLRSVGGNVRGKCGCYYPHKTLIRIDGTTKIHSAHSTIVPIICPMCGKRTVVPHKKVRGA